MKLAGLKKYNYKDVIKMLNKRVDELKESPESAIRDMTRTYYFKTPKQQEEAEKAARNHLKLSPEQRKQKEIKLGSSNKVVKSFLNSGEGYFHTKRIIQDQWKQPRALYGPMSCRPEKWDYTDIRDISMDDYDRIIKATVQNIDRELYQKIAHVALKASLDYTIHSLDRGRYQKKIDSPTYNLLYKILTMQVGN